ncbi:MAG: hypothetical protein P4L67_04355 [Candidatus Pacebacteria bacterium]|nr:hypothetical protein [Candidatus Paceibacterota bacterium]
MECILELCLLEHRGLLDSPEAESVRGKSDTPWDAMTDDERKRASRFSAVLERMMERAMK